MSRDLDKITTPEESAKDRQIASLESQLQDEKDGRKGERFVFCLALVIAFDAAALKDISWLGWIAVLFMELLIVLVLGRMCGIDDVALHISNAGDAIRGLIDAIRGKAPSSDPSNAKPVPSSHEASISAAEKVQVGTEAVEDVGPAPNAR